MIAVSIVAGIYALLATIFAVQQYNLRMTAARDAQDSRLQLQTLAVTNGRSDAWLRGMVTNLVENQKGEYSKQTELLAILTSPGPAPVINLGQAFPEEVDDVTKPNDFDPTDQWDPPIVRESYIAPEVPGA